MLVCNDHTRHTNRKSTHAPTNRGLDAPVTCPHLLNGNACGGWPNVQIWHEFLRAPQAQPDEIPLSTTPSKITRTLGPQREGGVLMLALTLTEQGELGREYTRSAGQQAWRTGLFRRNHRSCRRPTRRRSA